MWVEISESEAWDSVSKHHAAVQVYENTIVKVFDCTHPLEGFPSYRFWGFKIGMVCAKWFKWVPALMSFRYGDNCN